MIRIGQWFSGSSLLLAVVLVPGILYRWGRRGIRGEKTFWFLLESAICGLGLTAGVFVGVSIWHGSFGGGLEPANIIAGVFAISQGAFARVLGDSVGVDTVIFIAVTYGGGMLAGWGVRYLENRKREFTFAPHSALDVELARWRDRRQVPRLTVQFQDGTELNGRCRIYTFTEPRELLLELTDEDGKLLWLKLDERVATIRLDAPAESEPRKVIRLPRNTK